MYALFGIYLARFFTYTTMHSLQGLGLLGVAGQDITMMELANTVPRHEVRLDALPGDQEESGI